MFIFFFDNNEKGVVYGFSVNCFVKLMDVNECVISCI